jgi:hypothetical protein
MSKRFRHASRFLGNHAVIASLLSGIQRNAELLRAIRGLLPRPLSEHCLHAAIEDGKLILFTDSPLWGSRLRFFFPELERSLPRRFGGFDACRIRVRPSSEPRCNPASSSVRARLSDKTVRHLIETAEGVKDEELAAALRRLAGTGGSGH